MRSAAALDPGGGREPPTLHEATAQHLAPAFDRPTRQTRLERENEPSRRPRRLLDSPTQRFPDDDTAIGLSERGW